MAFKKDKIKTSASYMAKQVADKAVLVTDKAKEITDIKKNESAKNFLEQDVTTALEWIKQRNIDIQAGNYETDEASMPTLMQLMIGGEKGISLMSDKDRENYRNFLRKNTTKLAILTAMNPAIGISAAGLEMAASGLISTKESIGTTITGAGIAGASILAPTLSPVSYTAWYAAKHLVPQLRVVGLGIMAFGISATLFKSIIKTPVGKMVSESFDSTQELYNECSRKFEANVRIIDELLSEKVMCAVKIMEDTSRKISITIDDALHSDSNMRLMQYQEIVLKQYNSQREIEKRLLDLQTQYNKIKIENDDLTRKMMAYEKNMQITVGVGELLK